MIKKNGKGDFHNAYRPGGISEIYGQDVVKKIVQTGLDTDSLPKNLILSGPSGTAKTTTSRIIGMGLNCEKGITSEPCGSCKHCVSLMRGSHPDYYEINGADPTVKIQKLKDEFHSAPFMGKTKIFCFDECQYLSPKDQAIIMKQIEDNYCGYQFIFCAPDLKKIIPPLVNRCMPLPFDLVDDANIRQLLHDVSIYEGFTLNPDTLEAIVADAKGMPRSALMLLQRSFLMGNTAVAMSN